MFNPLINTKLLYLLIPLMAIAFNNRLSAWVIFILGTFHGLEHAMAGAIYALILALITLAVPGVYSCILAYRLARSSRTGQTPHEHKKRHDYFPRSLTAPIPPKYKPNTAPANKD
jgi:hypothetical protein